MNKSYFLRVLFLCGLSVGNVFTAASADVAGFLGDELSSASIDSDKAKIERLIAAMTNVNAVSQFGGYTALMRVAKWGHENIVERLLQIDGIDVNAQAYYDGRTALMEAARKGHEKIVERLLQVDGIDVNAQANYRCNGRTALMEAARKGHENILERLLQVDGIDVNAQANYNGWTAFYNGWTALMFAAHKGHEKTVERLLYIGADKENIDNQTAEAVARAAGYENLANMIRDYVRSSGRTVKRAVTGPDKNYM